MRIEDLPFKIQQQLLNDGAISTIVKDSNAILTHINNIADALKINSDIRMFSINGVDSVDGDMSLLDDVVMHVDGIIGFVVYCSGVTVQYHGFKVYCNGVWYEYSGGVLKVCKVSKR
jgi:hypothetical protein